MVRGLTWMLVNHIATPVTAPSTKLTSTSTLKEPSMNRRASGQPPRMWSHCRDQSSSPPPMANCARNTWTMPRPPIASPFMSGPRSTTGWCSSGVMLSHATERPSRTMVPAAAMQRHPCSRLAGGRPPHRCAHASHERTARASRPAFRSGSRRRSHLSRGPTRSFLDGRLLGVLLRLHVLLVLPLRIVALAHGVRPFEMVVVRRSPSDEPPHHRGH